VVRVLDPINRARPWALFQRFKVAPEKGREPGRVLALVQVVPLRERLSPLSAVIRVGAGGWKDEMAVGEA
jgi:hypothetical protein